jgi:uncharacterized membrane protein
MSTGQEIAAIVGACVVAVVGIVVTLQRIFVQKTTTVCPINAGDSLDNVADAIHEQTRMLGEIRDKLVGMGYEQQQAVTAVGRVETSVVALHRRFDSITGPRE